MMKNENNEGKETNMNVKGWQPFLVNWKPVTLYIIVMGCIMTGGNFMVLERYKESSNLFLTAITLMFFLVTFYTKPNLK